MANSHRQKHQRVQRALAKEQRRVARRELGGTNRTGHDFGVAQFSAEPFSRRRAS